MIALHLLMHAVLLSIRLCFISLQAKLPALSKTRDRWKATRMLPLLGLIAYLINCYEADPAVHDQMETNENEKMRAEHLPKKPRQSLNILYVLVGIVVCSVWLHFFLFRT
jgi:hypothetical protein